MTLTFPEHYAHSACKGTGKVERQQQGRFIDFPGTIPCPEPNCFHGIDLDLVREGEEAARRAVPDDFLLRTTERITTLQDRVRELEGEHRSGQPAVYGNPVVSDLHHKNRALQDRVRELEEEVEEAEFKLGEVADSWQGGEAQREVHDSVVRHQRNTITTLTNERDRLREVAEAAKALGDSRTIHIIADPGHFGPVEVSAFKLRDLFDATRQALSQTEGSEE